MSERLVIHTNYFWDNFFRYINKFQNRLLLKFCQNKFLPKYIAPYSTARFSLDYPPVKLFYFSDTIYLLEIIEIKGSNGAFKIYSIEKIICDAFRYRNRIGEPLPTKPEYLCSDGGLLITIKVPTILASWETSVEEDGEPLFQVYKYLPESLDKANLYYEKVIRMSKGDNHIKSDIYFSPGRYYFRLVHCKFTISNTVSFNPENWFIQFNESTEEKPIPKRVSVPESKIWRAFYNMNFRIRKADLYLGYETKMLENHHLIFGAFYHAPDKDNIIRTFIFDGKEQLVEGQKI